MSLGQWCVWSGLNLKCDVLGRELIDIFVYWRVLHEQQNTGRGRTLHCKMQPVLFFNSICSAPLKLVWCNKANGYKTNKNLLWFNTQKFRRGCLFFWLGVKSLSQNFPLPWYSIRILTSENFLHFKVVFLCLWTLI